MSVNNTSIQQRNRTRDLRSQQTVFEMFTFLLANVFPVKEYIINTSARPPIMSHSSKSRHQGPWNKKAIISTHHYSSFLFFISNILILFLLFGSFGTWRTPVSDRLSLLLFLHTFRLLLSRAGFAVPTHLVFDEDPCHPRLHEDDGSHPRDSEGLGIEITTGHVYLADIVTAQTKPDYDYRDANGGNAR